MGKWYLFDLGLVGDVWVMVEVLLLWIVYKDDCGYFDDVIVYYCKICKKFDELVVLVKGKCFIYF